jgi:hypothetical protein
MVYNSMYWYVLFCICMDWYVMVCTVGKPLLGGLTVEDTALKKDSRREEQAKCSVETRLCRKADKG